MSFESSVRWIISVSKDVFNSWWNFSNSWSRGKEPAISKCTLLWYFRRYSFSSPKSSLESWKLTWSFPNDTIFVCISLVSLNLATKLFGSFLIWPIKWRGISWERWINIFSIGIKFSVERRDGDTLPLLCPNSIETVHASFVCGDKQVICDWDIKILWHLNNFSW